MVPASGVSGWCLKIGASDNDHTLRKLRAPRGFLYNVEDIHPTGLGKNWLARLQ